MNLTILKLHLNYLKKGIEIFNNFTTIFFNKCHKNLT